MLQWLLEAALWLTVAGSVLAFGAVHSWAHPWLWAVAIAAGALALAYALASRASRRRRGPSSDLGEPALPRGPLLLPGLAMIAFVLLQLAPIAGGPATLAPEATRRGLMFVLGFVALHQAAAVAFVERGARRRFRQVVAWLGALISLVALVQLASGSELVYGFFRPLEGGRPYGPFVNRNHFAGYLLLVVPIALFQLADAWRAYARRVGSRPSLRRALVGLSTRDGTRLVYAGLPPLLGIGALLASTSRGGILAFVAALALAAAGVRKRRGTSAWAAALVFAAMGLAWFGLERLEARFLRAAQDAPGRSVLWRESVQAIRGRRFLIGYGLNTYAEAISRVPAWGLPKGATPWPEPVARALESGVRHGYRAPDDLPGLAWYREAHNDYVQLLVECGLPGLLVGLWAALAALAAARGDAWLFAALAGVLMHSFVDFDLQIPAISALFVTLSALGRGKSG